MPSVKKTGEILDFISDNPNDPKSVAAAQKMGLSAGAIGAWREVKATPDHPKRTEVRNKVFDMISQKLPASQEVGGVGFVDRFVVKNLIDRDPDLQQKYLKSKGFETRIVADQLEAKKPGEAQFSAVDPEGFDRFDVFDVFGDALEAVVTGVASGAKAIGLVGAPATGGASLLAASALGGAATAGFETGKQQLAKLVGAREEFDPGRIAQAGVLGAAIPGGSIIAGKVFKGAGSLLGRATKVAAPKKEAAAEIAKAAETLGAKATPGQLFDSPLVQKLESSLHQSTGKLGGIALRGKIKANQKIVQDTANVIVKDAAEKTAFEVGDQAKDQILKRIGDALEPAEALYSKYESIFRRKAFKPNSKPILNTIKALEKEFKFDDKTLGILKSFKQKVGNINNLDELKKFRTIVGERARDFEGTTATRALNRLYGETTDVRSKTLLDLAEARGGDFFDAAKREIEQADEIYKTVINEVQTALGERGAKIAGSPRQIAKKFFEKNPEVNRINKILKSNDPSKIAAVKKAFPEAFETLRQGKIQEIAEKATFKGDVSARKLTTILSKLPKETTDLLLGPGSVEKAKALKTYLDALPDMLGPSGTPQGLEFFKLFNIAAQAGSVSRSRMLSLLTNSQLGKDIFSRTGRMLQTPGFTTGAEFTARQLLPREQQKQEPAFALPK